MINAYSQSNNITDKYFNNNDLRYIVQVNNALPEIKTVISAQKDIQSVLQYVSDIRKVSDISNHIRQVGNNLDCFKNVDNFLYTVKYELPKFETLQQMQAVLNNKQNSLQNQYTAVEDKISYIVQQETDILKDTTSNCIKEITNQANKSLESMEKLHADVINLSLHISNKDDIFINIARRLKHLEACSACMQYAQLYQVLKCNDPNLINLYDHAQSKIIESEDVGNDETYNKIIIDTVSTIDEVSINYTGDPDERTFIRYE